ncbi:5'-methylthioadenosine/S-adenosylhomocysteine nucleosidase [Brevundimonas sp. NIBR11]|uniref:5'-methylthioadenosine/S-adenosylhomocysteine nucleosidase n=1 Tax=Brevundimonas sp. NIBR11 TaxID=3015999 RepID=UPI0022F0DBC0|nr:5'-methylthioadenosine/S-adenosylhomocysteine nucleosidase [Brevundimonas sp. NIBR11]WGM30699.1 5'-methylthioadenosine/S-adenosylhomocysteine nucleosidase [Brevundimonas sp. NIBR11]
MSRTFELTQFGPLTALCVMAAELEYGPALKARIKPLITGVGPVEAAVGTTEALALLERDGALPDLIISLGSAGSQTLDHGRVYWVDEVSYRDMDASAIGFAKGVTPFLDEEPVLTLASGPAGQPYARLATGASVVSGEAYDDIDAEMVDMETYAVVRAAAKFGVPVMGLRGISDGKADLTVLEDWTNTLSVIDEGLAEALDLLKAEFERLTAEAGEGA